MIVLSVIGLFILLVVAGAMFGWNRVTEELEKGEESGFVSDFFSNEDQPRIDATVAKHQLLIESIENIIATEDSKFQVAAKLEKLDLPEDVLYLALSNDVEHKFEPEVTEILRRIDWNSHSISTFNGTGQGTLYANLIDQEVIVVKRDIEGRPFADEWTMYFVDPGPAEKVLEPAK